MVHRRGLRFACGRPQCYRRPHRLPCVTRARADFKYMAGEYHESDFNVDDIATDAQAQLKKQAEEAELLQTSDASDFPALNWEQFHATHSSAKFFKPRRYVSLAFPELMQPNIRVVELGCGAGASIIPVLQANSTCNATVSDVSATAVSNLQLRADSMGISRDRLHAFVSDATDPDNHALASAASEGSFGPADIVMLIFTLSAVSPDAMSQALQSAWAELRPGGMLLVRDYGRYDMAALRFPPEQRIADGLYYRLCASLSKFDASTGQRVVVIRCPLCVSMDLVPVSGDQMLRIDHSPAKHTQHSGPMPHDIELLQHIELLCSQDGTLAYFFSEDDLNQRCEAAGFECSYVKYARVKLVNKKKQKEMRRVFIQGKFIKTQ